MNTKSFLPLTAAALFAVCAGSALISSQNADAARAQADQAARIVDLAAVTVRPDPADLAAYHASRIVELPAVTVRPDAQDLAFHLAQHTARIVDLPAVTVRASAQDMERVAIGTATLAQQLAAR
jgi:hypothetical protein